MLIVTTTAAFMMTATALARLRLRSAPWRLRLGAMALCAGLAASPAHAAPNYAVLARAKFIAREYDESITYYRLHLRRMPRDFNAWNQLGAAYYHTGQPRKALRYLKHVERKTSEKSYNFYYQGLAYQATELPAKAREYLGYAAQSYSDEYASRCTFEMAALDYNAKDKAQAYRWLTLYLRRYPTGVYAAQANQLLRSLQEDRWLDNVEGTRKPNIEEALFKYNKLSLSPHPHYWFLQGGWEFADVSGFEPAPAGGLKARVYQTMGAIVNGGVGVGPWREGSVTAFGGYTYRQRWITDLDRIDTYMEDPTDFTYFPLRGDLLERQHQFYGDFRRDIGKVFYFGAFGRYEFGRIGSSLFPGGSESEELRKVLKMSDTQLLIPWMGVSYLDTMRTLAYLYLRKEINEDSPEHSNKSYDFGGEGGQPVLSLGVSQEFDFPDQQASLSLELFRYEFIYNDNWLDYTRQGLFASVEHEFIPRWFVTGVFGYYEDSYVLPRLKQLACGAEPPPVIGNSLLQNGSTPPNNCVRKETGMLYQLGTYWNWTQFQRFAFQYQTVENRNPKQKEFDESKWSVHISYTMAFPSVKRVARFVDRYADTAFTKEAE